jgi:hypothetical protein
VLAHPPPHPCPHRDWSALRRYRATTTILNTYLQHFTTPIPCNPFTIPRRSVTMNFKDKFRKVFHRNSNGHSNSNSSSNSKSKSNGNGNGNGIKIEYYKRGEIPPSKFRGPFDPEHQKRLAAWSFEAAQAERPRALDPPLSPCTTVSQYLNPCHGESEDEGVAPDQICETAPPEVGLLDCKWLLPPLHSCPLFMLVPSASIHVTTF